MLSFISFTNTTGGTPQVVTKKIEIETSVNDPGKLYLHSIGNHLQLIFVQSTFHLYSVVKLILISKFSIIALNMYVFVIYAHLCYFTYYIIIIIDSKPNKLHLLTPLAYKWKETGKALDIRHQALMSLHQSHFSNEQKLSDVIQLWISLNMLTGVPLYIIYRSSRVTSC